MHSSGPRGNGWLELATKTNPYEPAEWNKEVSAVVYSLEIQLEIYVNTAKCNYNLFYL